MMTAYIGKIVVIFFLCLQLCSCITNIDAPVSSIYGEPYFTMDCIWRSHGDGETLWWCMEEVETDLVTGFLGLELLEDGRLAFCGEDLLLNTGHALHDNLVSALTEGQFICILNSETELGNEFDWIWSKEDKTLQIIWRPEEEVHKQLTLVIDSGISVTDVIGRMYYKELN